MRTMDKMNRTDIFLYFNFECTIAIVTTRDFSSTLQLFYPKHNIR